MGLRFSDALRLSWSNIGQYKKRSAMIVLMIAVFFGVLLAILFAASGLEKTIIRLSADNTHGAAYLKVRYRDPWASDNRDSDIVGIVEDLNELDYEKIAPHIDESDLVRIQERVARYNGEIVGYAWRWQSGYLYNVVTLSAAEAFLDRDLSSTPEGKIPVLVPSDWRINEVFLVDEFVASTFYQVGETPITQSGSPILPGFNPLNIILSQVSGDVMTENFFIVSDNPEEVGEYVIAQARNCMEKTDESCVVWDTHPYKEVVVKFTDIKQAVAFATPEQKLLDIPVYTNFPFIISDLFGSTEITASSIFNVRTMILPIIGLLLMVAFVVTILTFAQLIDHDAATVALYRLMGASTGDIYLIYFLYLLELCVLAVFASVAIASFLIGMLQLSSGKVLARRLQEYYYLSNAPKVTLVGFDGLFWVIVVSILFLAPTVLLFSLRHFSAKNIARKLKRGLILSLNFNPVEERVSIYMTIRLRNINKTYDKKGILHNVSLVIPHDSLVMLSGASGSGKTTLLNIIGGIEQPTTGEVLIDGYEVNHFRGKKRADFYRHKIGFVFQGFHLHPQLTICENIALAGVFVGMPRSERIKRVLTLAEPLGITGALNYLPAKVSGGQAERACVARALFMNPEILLADEPTNNLDPDNAKNLVDVLKRIQQEVGITVVIASHDPIVRDYATRVLHIDGGSIVYDEKLGDVRDMELDEVY